MPLRKIGKVWYIDLYINGKRIQKRASANRGIAQRILNELLAKRDLARFGLVPDNCSLEDLKEKFLNELQPRVLPKTFHDYCVRLQTLLDFIGDTPFEALRDKINQFIKWRQEQGIAPRTINRAIDLLNRMINYGIQTHQIKDNPLTGLTRLKVKDCNRRPLSDSEVTILLGVSGRYRIFWLTFILTGLRLSELVNLKWDDIDFQMKTLTVKESKTEAGIATIPMSPIITAELQKYKEGSKLEYVFTTQKGTQFKNNLLKRFKWCLAKAGLNPKEFDIHSLRYTFASKLIQNGVHPKMVQMLMRHRSVQTSLDIYAKVFNNDLVTAVEKMKV